MYLSAHKATRKLGISSDILCRWLKQGRITAKTSPSGTCLYDISSIFPELTSQDADYTTTTTTTTTVTAAAAAKKGFFYARVSNVKQKEDLERQKQLLRSRYPTYELISDIGSGVNFKQLGLKTLLERTSRGIVSEIVVTHRDRLCHFAFDLIQYILSLHTTNSWFSSTMRPLMNTNFPKISLQSIQSLSAECKEEEPLFTDENTRLGKKHKTKIRTTSA